MEIFIKVLMQVKSISECDIKEVYYNIAEIMIEMFNYTTDVFIIHNITNYLRVYIPVCSEMVIHKYKLF